MREAGVVVSLQSFAAADLVVGTTQWLFTPMLRYTDFNAGLGMPPPLFSVQTCEGRISNQKPAEFRHVGPYEFTPFEADDPFGMRKAILPVFERKADGSLVGMGTAFHIDGWGGCLTAEHVIEFVRSHLPDKGLEGQSYIDINPSVDSHPVLLLGMGICYGVMSIPNWAVAPVVGTHASTRKRKDPIKELQGKSLSEVAADLAHLQVCFHQDAQKHRNYPHSLPVDLRRWQPSIGEYVLAFGFQKLKPSRVLSESEIQSVIEDDLYCAYGRITNIFPDGRGAAHPTPVFEVEANWQPGMSGGPVFNEGGDVIGVVSRSLLPEDDLPGYGYAACLPWNNRFCAELSRLDYSNPGWRRGFGVINSQGQLLEVCPDRKVAYLRASHACSARVVSCSQRIGASDYVFGSD